MPAHKRPPARRPPPRSPSASPLSASASSCDSDGEHPVDAVLRERAAALSKRARMGEAAGGEPAAAARLRADAPAFRPQAAAAPTPSTTSTPATDAPLPTPAGVTVRADDAPPSTTAAARRLMRPTRYYDDGDGTNDGVDDGAGGPRCYRCGGRHLQRECSAPAPLKPCFACGELGHERAACPNGTRRGGRGDEARRRCRQRPTPHHPPLLLARCFRCGQAGHQARACTSSATTRPHRGSRARSISGA